eukprot:GHVQ01011287.1.p1 GENE.GHVQ01011287.1~~GHVQ01011287.1.p1  ORF type:complete len:187 (+),score=16.90 GHVQ01011287.1:115-675(+)
MSTTYTYTFIFICAYTHIYIFMCTHTHIYVYIFICIHTNKCICALCVSPVTSIFNMFVYVNIYIYIATAIRTQQYSKVYVHKRFIIIEIIMINIIILYPITQSSVLSTASPYTHTNLHSHTAQKRTQHTHTHTHTQTHTHAHKMKTSNAASMTISVYRQLHPVIHETNIHTYHNNICIQPLCTHTL